MGSLKCVFQSSAHYNKCSSLAHACWVNSIHISVTGWVFKLVCTVSARVFSATRPHQAWRLQLTCGGGSLFGACYWGGTRYSLGLWFVTGWVWMMSGRSEDSWFIWDLGLLTLLLLPPGLVGLWGSTGVGWGGD